MTRLFVETEVYVWKLIHALHHYDNQAWLGLRPQDSGDYARRIRRETLIRMVSVCKEYVMARMMALDLRQGTHQARSVREALTPFIINIGFPGTFNTGAPHLAATVASCLLKYDSGTIAPGYREEQFNADVVDVFQSNVPLQVAVVEFDGLVSRYWVLNDKGSDESVFEAAFQYRESHLSNWMLAMCL